MGQAKEIDAIKDTIKTYFDGTYAADVDKLKAAFHEKATLSGYITTPKAPDGTLLICGMDMLYGDMPNHESPKDSGNDYEARILSIQIDGKAAAVTAIEEGLYGGNFVNFLILHKLDERWVIVAKAFNETSKA